MAIPQADIQIIRAEAAAVVKQHLRAEARAQATIAKKDLADQFNRILEDDRRRSAEKTASMAEALAQLCVKVEVLADMLVEVDRLAFGDKTWRDLSMKERREELDRICKKKHAEFLAPGGRA